MILKVAALQFHVKLGDKDANMFQAEDMIAEAAAAGAKLILLPELWNCGFDKENLEKAAEDIQGPAVSMLRTLAKKYNMFIIGGSFVEKKQGHYFNTCPVIDAGGSIVEKYRKVHLFSYGWHEEEYFAPGDEWSIIESPFGFLAGLTICYDLRFPEFYRNLALRGARLLTVPAEWPEARIAEFEIFCRSRAAENRCYLIATNACGDGYGGTSLIVSPFGEILAKAGEENEIIFADLDFAVFDEVQFFNSIKDRRQFLDEIDDNQL